MLTQEPVEVRLAENSDTGALLSFTSSYFGPRSHQASRRRIEWLYDHNPLSCGFSREVTIAVAGDRVVGCHWKTRLPWRIGGEPVAIPSPHDLALLAGFRESGGMQPPGLRLALGVLNREPHAALLGLSPASEAIFSRFQCQKASMLRLRKIISVPRTVLGLLRGKCGGSHQITRPDQVRLEWKQGGYQIEAASHPDDAAIESVLRLRYSGECYLDWNPATYRWRFFHPLGPSHFLVSLNALSGVAARAVFSYGLRRGAVMARLVDAAAETPVLYPLLIAVVEKAMRRLGIAVATAATTSAPAQACLQERGWRVQHGVESRFYSRPVRILDLADVWGGAYDYGFDAL